MADVAVIPNVENPVPEKAPPPVPEAEPMSDLETVVEQENLNSIDEKIPEILKVINVDLQKKALEEFKALVQEALNNHEFSPPKKNVVSVQAAGTEENVAPSPGETTTTTETTELESVVSVASAEVGETTDLSVIVADDDGAKTVEAIEETVVSVSSIPTEQESEQTQTPAVSQEEKSPEEVSIWGIPLLEDERTDAVLFKFLQARDFKPKDALTMLKKTVLWRKEFEIEGLIEEKLEKDGLDGFAFLDGFSRSGNPVCYNRFGVFQDKEIYKDSFGDAEKRREFLRWRVQMQEKSIRKMLDFGVGGVCTFVQVNDFKNSPFLLKRELKIATDEALQLLQDNYPEFVAKQVFINVPWWYIAFQTVINPFLTQRTKSKFVFVGPSKSTDTLFKYIAPEQVPVEYGGFSKAGEQEFTTTHPVIKEIIKPSSAHTVELNFSEPCDSVWEVRVNGWDVSYGAEFVPSAEDGFTVIVQKIRKINQGEETVISGSFKVNAPGKIVLTFDNQTSKKKKLLYRSKTKPSAC